MLDPFYNVCDVIYTVYCGLAIKPFDQSETTITLEFSMARNHEVQFNTFIITNNYQVQVKSKSGIVFVLSACIVASDF